MTDRPNADPPPCPDATWCDSPCPACGSRYARIVDVQFDGESKPVPTLFCTSCGTEREP